MLSAKQDKSLKPFASAKFNHRLGKCTWQILVQLRFKTIWGLEKIRIGAKAFMCTGAKAPFDHPHVFLEMGDDNERICPYCSTLFVYDSSLSAEEADPPEAVYREAV